MEMRDFNRIEEAAAVLFWGAVEVPEGIEFSTETGGPFSFIAYGVTAEEIAADARFYAEYFEGPRELRADLLELADALEEVI